MSEGVDDDCELIRVIGNSVPEGLHKVFYTGFEKAVRCALWHHSKRIKRGSLIILPGFAESIELQFPLIQEGLARGYNVLTFDWRGQGMTKRQGAHDDLAHIDKFTTFTNDFHDLVRHIVLPDLPAPYYLIASDMAANLVLMLMPELRSWCARGLLISPLVGINHKQAHVWSALRFAKGLRWMGLGRAALPGVPASLTSLGGDWRTSSLESLSRLASVGQAGSVPAIRAPTIALADELGKTMRIMRHYSFPSRGQIPFLVLSGSNDSVIDIKALNHLVSNLRGSHAITIKGGRHKLLWEKEKVLSQVWRAFDAYVAGTLF